MRLPNIEEQKENIKKREEKYFEILKNVLEKNDISMYYYNIGGYSEDKVCIEKYNNMWLVYNGERGIKHDKEICISLDSAGCEIIKRLSESKEIEKKMLKEYMDDTRRL